MDSNIIQYDLRFADKMLALKIVNGDVHLQQVPVPDVKEGDYALIRVLYAGICRTDIAIANHRIKCKNGVTLGHEFCGLVVKFYGEADSCNGFQKGDVVSANPMLFGVGFDFMCGKDCDGAFAEYIVAPVFALVKLDKTIANQRGAFIEPVAAALAPIGFIGKNDKICVYGDNRIAELMCQILYYKEFNNVCHIINRAGLIPDMFDSVIETIPEDLDSCISALKPGGVLVAKSRAHFPVAITVNTLVMKEITIKGAKYGSFSESALLLKNEGSMFEHLFGKTYRLEEFETAFEDANKQETKKIFFEICAA
ncbi:MAG: alcohol dehydrogenase catalytic domain-containing protein [Bacteroidales bacterium]|nr:alcohol dehydrogenase catalytic domain-containing protein [Bacteroidales bacterium]